MVLEANVKKEYLSIDSHGIGACLSGGNEERKGEGSIFDKSERREANEQTNRIFAKSS